MATSSRESILGKIRFAENAITTALTNSTIATALDASGYDTTTLHHGLGLASEARALQESQIDELDDYRSVTDTLNSAWEQAQAAFEPLLGYARLAFQNDPSNMALLGLAGRRKTSFTGWLEQTTHFYTHALHHQEILDQLARYKVTPAQLEAGLAQVHALAETHRIQGDERGQSEHATKLRDAALDALDDWVDDFLAVARLALRDTPQLLESLGVHVRS